MKRWTEKEVRELAKNWELSSRKKMLFMFHGRTWKSLKRKAQIIGLKRPRKLHRQWESDLPDWMVGEMLSDGHIDHGGRYTHTTKYKQYADFLKKKFAAHGISSHITKDERVDSRTNKLCRRWILKTRCVFKKHRMEWYPHGKKSVPIGLTPTASSILHLFLGDGSVGKKNGLRLASMGFNDESRQRLVSFLSDFGFTSRVDGEGNLFFRKRDNNKPAVSRILVDAVFPSCYKYKMKGMQEWSE